MDRLFGRELSNFLQPQNLYKLRNLVRNNSQSNRGVSEDHSKLINKKVNKSYGNGAGNTNATGKVQKCEIVKNSFEKEKVEKKKDIKDVQLVGQYFEDCFKFMIQQESKSISSNYLPQTEINDRMRGILIDWLIDLHHKFKMFPQTLFAMVMIVDKYISKKGANKANLQLIGTASLFIAAKYEQTYQVPQISDLVHFSANSFTKQDIVKMEADIINALDFHLIFETSYRFFEPLAKICKMEDKNFHLAQYILEMSLLNTKFLEYKPSLMASSVIYLVNKIRKINEPWSCSLQSLTGYNEKDLKNCARELCHLLERAEDVANNKSLKKKFSLAQYNEVTRIKLQRKKQ